jgi:DNA-binding helix-hairpin-helix protein with protein kinase domain
MASFFIDDGAATPRPIRLSGAIAQGAAGTIHRVTGEPGIVAKLYKDSNDLPEYREKIAAMLTAPPHLPAFSYNGKNYVQIAWPTATVIDGAGFRGFVMPEVDFQESS